MLTKYADELYASMVKELGDINGSLKDSIQNLEESLSCIISALNKLKAFIIQEGFETPEKEIYFFKQIKPHFYSWYIYVIKLDQVVSGIPVGTDQMIRDYFLNELNVITRYFNAYQFSYQYYLQEETIKDDTYFLRQHRVSFPPGQEHLNADPEFSTNQDYVFSKFKAYEMLREFIIRRLKLLYQNPDNLFVAELLISKNRSWSGNKIELIEMAYGIYFSKRVNNGKANINDIIEWLEDSFHIDLSQASRIFIDVCRRKKLSITQYLDEMRDAIHIHIDQSNRYKPKSRSHESS